MLEKTFSFRTGDHEDEYHLSLPICRQWNTKKQRVLIVMQTVPTESLRAKTLLSKGLVNDTVRNSIEYAQETLKTYNKGRGVFPAWAVVNFNNRRHLNLPPRQKAEAEQEFGNRIRKAIKKLKPTHVFVTGDIAAERIYGPEHPEYTRGYVTKKDGILYAHTMDLDRLLANDGHLSNLLGFWTRHLAHLLLGHHPFDIGQVTCRPYYVNTVKKFDAMMEVLRTAKIVSTDTEARNLTVLHNRLYTVQFATDANEERGYVIPVDHPMTPFSVKERRYIKKRLRAFYTSEPGTHSDPLMITYTGQFDLMLLRKKLNMNLVYHRTWEITAGEHLLDENVSLLNDTVQRKQAGGKITFGTLRATLARYGNLFYMQESGFSKEDRNRVGSVAPDDPDFLRYAAGDVVYLMHIYRMQCKMAATMDFNGNNYLKLYKTHVEHIMGPTVHQISHMHQDGSYIDRDYLQKLAGSQSPLIAEIKKVEEKLKKLKPVIECNKVLLADQGIKTKGLFGGGASWIFKASKPKHRARLFFDVMGMKPVSHTDSGEPAVDKVFLNHYRNDNEVVALYYEWSKLTKLLGTYVRGWRRLMSKDPDGTTDDCLRPSFRFFNVVTGRLSSQSPNLQQIPSRGPLADIIKRMFITPFGKLLIRFDYSAHEIRCWSIVSGDMELADAFRAGQTLRKAWIKTPTPEIKAELATKGDVHIQNVKRFFGKWVAKSDPLRDAVKGVVFGVLYGKAAKTLGSDIGKDEAYAQGIIDKMFQQFKKGGKWVDWAKKSSREKFVAGSILGRRRNLFAGLTGDRKIISQQVRRGSNAPIQGAASEMGTVASRRIMLSYYRMAEHLSTTKAFKGITPEEIYLMFNRLVHDASYFAKSYKMVIPFIHVLQHEATYGITQHLERIYGIKFTIEPEIEVEIGARDDNTFAWDWSMPSLIGALLNSVDDAQSLKKLSAKPEEVVAQLLAPHRDKRTRKYLQKHYPLLGVTDLEDVITSAESDYLSNVRKRYQEEKDTDKKAELKDTYKRHKKYLEYSL